MEKSSSHQSVLIVDPDFLSGQLTSLELEKTTGALCKWVLSGKEASALLSNGSFDLIITDFYLPFESGLDFIKRVRQLFSIPIMVLSADLTDENMIAIMETGADDFMHKPYSLTELAIRSSRLLQRRLVS